MVVVCPCQVSLFGKSNTALLAQISVELQDDDFCQNGLQYLSTITNLLHKLFFWGNGSGYLLLLWNWHQQVVLRTFCSTCYGRGYLGATEHQASSITELPLGLSHWPFIWFPKVWLKNSKFTQWDTSWLGRAWSQSWLQDSSASVLRALLPLPQASRWMFSEGSSLSCRWAEGMAAIWAERQADPSGSTPQQPKLVFLPLPAWSLPGPSQTDVSCLEKVTRKELQASLLATFEKAESYIFNCNH